MIIQALYQHYLDLSSDPASGVSELYFSQGKVSYLLELGQDGSLLHIQDLRVPSGKKLVPQSMQVPEQASRSSAIYPYFLMDKAEYILGYYPSIASESELAKKQTDAAKKFEASRALAQSILADVPSEMAKAVLLFYEKWDPLLAHSHPQLQPYISELNKGIETNMLFCLHTAPTIPAHETAEIKAAWSLYRASQDAVSDYEAQCLITGKSQTSIARLHDKIKGVRNAQQAGASLVSFNFPSSESYGKDKQQSYNAPVSRLASFGYTTALNHLLATRTNRISAGDMTVVFWSENAALHDTERFFARFMEGDLQESALDAMKLYSNTSFYVLGLSPNNARLAVRFFWSGSFGDLITKLAAYTADFRIISQAEQAYAHGTPSLSRILDETRKVGEDGRKIGDEAPDRIGGDLLRAILQGQAYPYSLYTAILGRVRTDGLVNALRVAIIKAYLTRYDRLNNPTIPREELTMSLNKESIEPAYRLGRLFSVLERAQQDAAGGSARLHSTLKDRYFNNAAANPGTVFPNLIRLAQNHMSKSEYGTFRDHEMIEILSGINQFPPSLTIQQQGLFILGYYHQKQDTTAKIKTASEAKQEAALAADQS